MSQAPRPTDDFPAPLTVLRTYHNRPTLDPLYISDLHRRHAGDARDTATIEKVSSAFYAFGAAMTWLGNEMPFGHSTHKQTAINMAKHLSTIAGIAKDLGAKDVCLPLKSKTPLAKYIQRIIKEHGVDGHFSFRDRAYNTDLTCEGKQDLRIEKNALHKSDRTMTTLRGFWFINENLKDKWDRELAVNPAVRPQCKNQPKP